jgi:aryl-alcohol dehydrogenase-like predicted oxidoreductase
MGFSQGYGPADDAESVATIHAAVDAGIALLDTAMSYGQGHNERVVGRALAENRGRGSVQVATKVGIVRAGHGVRLDAHPRRIADYCDQSLARLGIDTIDLYYLHRVDPAVPLVDTIGAMARLVDAGKVRHLGLSEVTPDQLAEAAAVHPIAAVQFEWSLLWRDPERDIVPAARALGIGLVAYSPLGRGLLTATLDRDRVAQADFRASDPRFQDESLAHNLEQVRALHQAAQVRGLTAGQLALAWLLAQGDDVVPIPGTRHAARIAENAAAADVELNAQDLAQLDALLPPSGWSGDRRSFAAPVTTRARW